MNRVVSYTSMLANVPDRGIREKWERESGMTLSKKQVKQLRSMANLIKPSLWIGKEGVSEAALKQVDETLEAHELIKCVVQEGSPVNSQEAGKELADRSKAELVQVIGRRVVLYRRTHREGIKRIALTQS